MPHEKETGNIRKIFKISGIVLGVFVVLTFILSILFLSLLEPIAGQYVKKQVYDKSDGLYKIEFEDIQINLFDRSASIIDFHLIPDSSIFLNSKAEIGRTVAEIKAPVLKIKNINFVEILFHNKIHIGEINIYKPIIEIFAEAADSDSEKKIINLIIQVK